MTQEALQITKRSLGYRRAIVIHRAAFRSRHTLRRPMTNLLMFVAANRSTRLRILVLLQTLAESDRRDARDCPPQVLKTLPEQTR